MKLFTQLSRLQQFVLVSSLLVAIAWFTLYLVLIPLFPAINDYYFTQQNETFSTHRIGLLIHIFFGTLALGLGAVNILLGLKRKTTKLHHRIGRLYGISVFIAAPAGLYMAQFAFGGTVGRIGFSALAVLWFSTLIAAMYAILIKRDLSGHAFWIILNFSLTFAAVTLRIQIAPVANLSNFESFYAIIAWSCWIPNLIVGYLVARREQRYFSKK
jgi:hypothetical protein